MNPDSRNEKGRGPGPQAIVWQHASRRSPSTRKPKIALFKKKNQSNLEFPPPPSLSVNALLSLPSKPVLNFTSSNSIFNQAVAAAVTNTH